MNIEEASKYLGLSVHSTGYLVRNNQIPGAKVGRGWRFLKADLDQFIRAQYKTETKVAVQETEGA
jgi:excisionase family DNA binding protein